MNDWIVAGINNPDFTVSDFKNIADMSTKDTLMLKREDYLKSNFIKNNELFKDENGKFSTDKFNRFYDLKLKEYQEFSTNDFYDGPELDPFSTFRTAKSKIKAHGFDISLALNPDRLRIGIEGINVWSDPTMSKQEIALSQKVWNSEKGKYEDYKPDDHALFSKPLEWIKDLFKDPLVMATYDEDTVDLKTGKLHKKGEYKLNDEGTYYYETLNGRSPVGKETLSVFDVLTAEGSAVNKYDFFDSDDINKSVPGVIAKNVATLAPLFLGGPWATTQSIALIGREMAKSMPLLYDMTTSLLGTESTPEFLNSIAGIGAKFTSGTSLYSKENLLSFENLASMVSDVALLWGLQKAIANTINKLRGANTYIDDAMANAKNLYLSKLETFPGQVGNPARWQESELGLAAIKRFLPEAERMTEKATRLGRDMSLVYMSIISNSDVFLEAVNSGASRKEAAAIALGSTLGMFAVDKTGLGELMFDDATDDAVKSARNAIKKEIFGSKADNYVGARQVFESIANSKKDERFKLVQLIKTAADTAKNTLEKFSDDIKYHTTNAIEKMIGEGVEEVAEEVVTDTAKGIYELAGKLGFDTLSKDVGAWDNAMERYGMSFLGGAIGGGVFYGKEVWDGKSFKNDKSNQELTTLIRNGHTQELYDELEKVRAEGKAGSRELSAYDYETTKDDDKENKIWLSAKSESESQNQKIADMVKDKITAIDAILNNNQVNLNDDLLFLNMVLSEARYARFQELAPITNYYEDFNLVLVNLIQAESDLRNAQDTLDGKPDGVHITSDSGAASLAALNDTQKAQRVANLKKYQDKLEEARQAKNDFLSGKTSLDYTRKLNFALDPMLSDLFIPTSFMAVWQEKHKDKNFDEATDLEKKDFIEEYSKLKSTPEFKTRLTEAWEKYKEIEQVVAPELLRLSDPNFKRWYLEWDKLKHSGKFDFDKFKERFIDYNTKLDGESDEDYANRDTKLKLVNLSTGEIEYEESNDEFNARRAIRLLKIDQYNNAIRQEFVDLIKQELAKVNNVVDDNTLRWILTQIDMRLKDALDYELIVNGANKNEREIYKNLKPDLSNVNEIINEVLKNYTDTFDKETFREIKDFGNTEVDDIYQEGSKVSLKDVVGSREEVTLGEALNGEFETEMNAEDYQKFMEFLQNKIAPYFDEDTSLSEIMNYEGYDSLYGDNKIKFDKAKEDSVSTKKNSYQSMINSIKTNPIYDLRNSFKATVLNPINLLIDKIANTYLDKNSMLIPQVKEILEKVESNFENIDDVHDLELDSVQMESLTKTIDILRLVSAYVLAASLQANTLNPIGHNKMINEFARNHKDLVELWDELPEIDSSDAVIYQKTLLDFADRLTTWMNLSLHNTINKRALFVRTDKAFQKALYDYIVSSNFKPKIDDKSWDLLEGADTSDEDTRLFNLEQTIHNNFQKALLESGLSTKEFLEKSGLFNNLNLIGQQKSVELSGKMKSNELTDYDKAIYLATILSLNPSDFYSKLKDKIAADKKIAPIVTLEYASKITIAALSLLFKDIMSYLHDVSGDDKYHMAASVFINGVAGAGKTKVVINSITDYVDPKDIIVAGPTKTLRDTLQKDLGISKGYTIPELMLNILTDSCLAEIDKAIKETTAKETTVAGNKILTFNENPYFTAYEGPDQIVRYSLKNDAPLEFKDSAPKAKALVIDEATHMNSIYALVLDKYMQSIDGTLILAGDTNQNGYSSDGTNGAPGLDNIQEYSVFMARTPKLLTSLRDNNIQKLHNLTSVRTIIDLVNKDILDLSEDEFTSKYQFYKNLFSKLNFSAYDTDDINGDLITSAITTEIKGKLLKVISKGSSEEPITIGFIGDKDTSAAYLQIKDLNPIVLTVDEMQGQEFDYVIIDQDFTEPKTSLETQSFIRNLYTLMSRGKAASIFVDKGLSNIIGKNNIENYKAKAPSIHDQINGKSAVDELKEEKLRKLDKYKLQVSEEAKTEPTETPKNPDEIFIDPESRNSKDSKDKLQQMETPDSGNEEVEGNYETSEWDVPIFSRASFLSVETKDDKVVGKDGKEHSGKTWTIRHGSEELRNLQALYPDGRSVFWYRDKLEMQRQLNSVRSFIMFNHKWDSTINGIQRRPAILSNFKQENWENGEYILEIRDSNGETLPAQSPFKKAGLTYNGKDYIVELVFKVKNNQGKVCKFDLGGINDPNTLLDKEQEIKDNLDEKINSNKYTDELKEKFKNIKATIHKLIQDYTSKFDTWITQYNQNGKFELDIGKAIVHDRVTRLVEGDKTYRLGGNIAPESFVTKRNADGTTEIYFDLNVWSVKDMNPDIIFSDVYVYGDAKLQGVDPSIKGKAVVFVSSDMSIPRDLLIQVYKEQKRDPEHNKPVVRMIVLNNHGMSMREMFSDAWMESFKRGVVGDSKPYSQNYMGVLMFVSMWNWRVGLNQFRTALNEWSKKYDDAKLNAILEAEDYLANKKPSDKNAYLQSKGVTLEEIDDLNKFNLEICKNIPIFRLGSPLKNGYYIREFDVVGSSVYDLAKANCIVVNPKTALKFSKLLDSFYENIVGEYGLNVSFLDYENLKDGKPLPWDEDKLIDPKQAKHRLSISGLFNIEGDTITLETGNENGSVTKVAFAKGDAWSAIPVLFGNVLSTINDYKKNPDKLSNQSLETARTYWRDKDGKNQNHQMQIGHWFDLDKELGEPLIKTVRETGRDVYEDGKLKEQKEDNTLIKMLSLMFHGTSDDFRNTNKKEYFARFPDGFFIHPATYSKDENAVTFNQSDIFYPIRTYEGLFETKLELRPAGFGLDLDILNGLKLKPKNDDTEDYHVPKIPSKLLEGTKVTFTNPDGNKVDGIINSSGILIPNIIGANLYLNDNTKTKILFYNNDGTIVIDGGDTISINDVKSSYIEGANEFDYGTIEEFIEDTHPILTALLDKLGGGYLLDDLDDINLMIQNNFENERGSVLDFIKGNLSSDDVKNLELLQNTRLTYKYNGTDLLDMSFEEWIKTNLVNQFGDTSDIKVVFNGDNVIINDKYMLNDDWEIVNTTINSSQEDSFFKKILDGESVESLISKISNFSDDSDMLKELIEFNIDFKDDYESKLEGKDFMQKLNRIIENSKQDSEYDVKGALMDLKSDYEDVTAFIEDKNEDLYKYLFEC